MEPTQCWTNWTGHLKRNETLNKLTVARMVESFCRHSTPWHQHILQEQIKIQNLHIVSSSLQIPQLNIAYSIKSHSKDHNSYFHIFSWEMKVYIIYDIEGATEDPIYISVEYVF